MNHDYDAIDEAYAIFARTGPEFGGGFRIMVRWRPRRSRQCIARTRS